MDLVEQDALAIPREPVSGRRLVAVARALLGVNVRALMEYRADFAMLIFFGVVFQLASLAFIGVVVARFHGIRDWTFHQVLLIIGVRLIAHGLWEPIFDNVPRVTYMVRDGWFDRILVRPMNPLVQVLLFQFRANGFGDLGMGIAVFAVAQGGLGIHWNALSVGFLLLVIAGSVLLEAGIHLIIATASFWWVRTDSLSWWADDTTQTFGNYPLPVFPMGARLVFTFVFPIALLSFFPASVFLGRAGRAPFTPLLAYGAPAIGLVVFVVAYRFWKIGLRHHQSTGT